MKSKWLLAVLAMALLPFFGNGQSVGSFDTTVSFMGSNRTLSCYVPTFYDSNATYRLIVGLHGQGDNSGNYRDALIHSLNWNSFISNTIFVFPDGGSDQNKDFYAPAGDEGIIPRAIEFARNNYSIDSNNIILQGFSLGGRSALKYGLDHPDDFKGLLLNTPAIQGWYDAINDSMAGLIYNYDNASEIPIYITVGEDDQIYSLILNNAKTVLKKNNARLDFHAVPDVGHVVPGHEYIQPSLDFFNNRAGANYDVDLFDVELDERICGTNTTPVSYIQNRGSAPITSVELDYQLGTNSGTHTWTGSLDTFEHAMITLPQITGAEGKHYLTVSVGNINGNQTDTTTENNTLQDSIHMITEGGALNFTEDFEDDSTDWINHESNTVFNWYGDSDVQHSGDMSMAAFNTILLFYSYGNVESFSSPVVDLTSVANPSISFDMAFNFHRYTPPYFMEETDFTDTLEILVSTDCGATYQSVYKKGGAELATADNPMINPVQLQQVWFNPNPDQWRRDTIPLDSFGQANEVIVKFDYISGMGGSIYLDNITLAGDSLSSGTQHQSPEHFTLYPNPASAQVQIQLENRAAEDLRIYDASGRMVKQMTLNPRQSSTTVRVADLNNGIYHVVLGGKEQQWYRKLVIAR